METYAKRLALAIGNIPLKELSERTGISVGALRTYLKETEPKLMNHVALAKGLGVSEIWLSRDEGPMSIMSPNERYSISYMSEHVFSEHQKLWHLKRKEHLLHIQVTQGWVQQMFDIDSSERLRWIYVDSDALSPFISRGNLVLVNLCQQEGDICEGFVAVCMDSSLIFRRIQPSGPGEVILTALNEEYKEMSLSRDQITAGERYESGKTTIIGTIIYTCHSV